MARFKLTMDLTRFKRKDRQAIRGWLDAVAEKLSPGVERELGNLMTGMPTKSGLHLGIVKHRKGRAL